MLDDFPNLSPLQENHWDTFRDLNKIVGTQFCKDNLIGLEQLLVIDYRPRFVQNCLNNAIMAPNWTDEDILGLPNLAD